jgi:hypothetical protein
MHILSQFKLKLFENCQTYWLVVNLYDMEYDMKIMEIKKPPNKQSKSYTPECFHESNIPIR